MFCCVQVFSSRVMSRSLAFSEINFFGLPFHYCWLHIICSAMPDTFSGGKGRRVERRSQNITSAISHTMIDAWRWVFIIRKPNEQEKLFTAKSEGIQEEESRSFGGKLMMFALGRSCGFWYLINSDWLTMNLLELSWSCCESFKFHFESHSKLQADSTAQLSCSLSPSLLFTVTFLPVIIPLIPEKRFSTKNGFPFAPRTVFIMKWHFQTEWHSLGKAPAGRWRRKRQGDAEAVNNLLIHYQSGFHSSNRVN